MNFRFRAHWEELTRHDDWNIGVVEAPIAAFLDPQFRPQVRWLPSPRRGSFRADPFGLSASLLLFEAYEDASERGRLMVWDFQTGRAEPVSGFPPDLHLSYPYLIEEDGEIYCIPEMWQANEIRLYRAESFPTRWVYEETLIEDTPGVDATFFRYGGRCWLAATQRRQAPGTPPSAEPDRDLYLWHAPALGGPWRAHRLHPAKSDLASSRPAGTPFWHQGALYRPAQDNSVSYGGGIVLNRILRLTPEEFAEEAVVHLAPAPEWPWHAGWHTLTAAGEVTFIDAKRYRCMPASFGRVLRRKLRRVWGRRA